METKAETNSAQSLFRSQRVEKWGNKVHSSTSHPPGEESGLILNSKDEGRSSEANAGGRYI